MEIFNKGDKTISDVIIRYGIEPKVSGKYKEILAEKNKSKKHQLIDNLILTLSKNSFQNGFFDFDYEIEINALKMQSFKIDDSDIYYNFFDNLEKYLKQEKNTTLATIKAILRTEKDYFGKLPTYASFSRRDILSQVKMNKNENWQIPSIKNFKMQDCSACAEYASVAHNLWLTMGCKSNYIVCKNTGVDNMGLPEGHAFNIIENKNGKVVLFDVVNGVISQLDNNPIENILSGKPLYVNGIIYANDNSLEK